MGFYRSFLRPIGPVTSYTSQRIMPGYPRIIEVKFQADWMKTFRFSAQKLKLQKE